MKVYKLSLVAALALTTSAFAIENVKVGGSVKAIYQTTDIDVRPNELNNNPLPQTGMFTSGNGQALNVSAYNGASAGGVSALLEVTADLMENLKAGAELQMFSTLGLSSNLLNDTMINSRYGTTGFSGGQTLENRMDDAAQLSQIWLGTRAGKTDLKAGRMELNTPMLFTEKWNIAKNTFEAAMATNTDIKDTTIIGAWVGKHNGVGGMAGEGGNLYAGSPGRTTNMHENFRKIGMGPVARGIFMAGAVNKSLPNTTAQLWYYNVVGAAQVGWAQADAKVGMFSFGAQYAMMDHDNALNAMAQGRSKNSSIVAVKAAVDIGSINLHAAFSSADKDGTLGFSNLSTADKTNIYTGTGSIYFDGVLTAPGVDAAKVGIKTKVADVKLAASYIHAKDIRNDQFSGADFSASTKFGPVGFTTIYTIVNNSTSANPAATAVTPGYNFPGVVGFPFYAGRDIQTLRFVASIKF